MPIDDPDSFAHLVQLELSYRLRLKEGDITPDQLYKAWILLAYEYFMRGAYSQAVSRVQWCTREYLEFVMPVQMQQDRGFRVVAHHLAKALVEIGVVDITPIAEIPRCPIVA